MSFPDKLSVIFGCFLFSFNSQASIDQTYQSFCASCHGNNLQGGMASSLIDGVWQHGGSVEEITQNITKGIPKKGMPAWEKGLSAEQIRGLVIYIQEQESEAKPVKPINHNQLIQTQKHNFKLQKIGEGDGVLWSIDFLPDGSLISAQKDGVLWVFKNGERTKIESVPDVWNRGQGGLLEAAVHPQYEKNGWIYLAYARNDGKNTGMTSIVRGKIKNNKWVEQEDIFKVDQKFNIETQFHFGSRIVFKDGYLFFGIGDRGRKTDAQDFSLPNGKIHRIFDDGRIPVDNPYFKSGYPTIYSIGNRNPQGLAIHPQTGELWESEHGPRGGDEINLITKGKNFGWPEITYGMNYNGTPMTALTEKSGMEQPKLYWVPSIAVSGIDFYSGSHFPKWQNNLLVASLAKEELHRLEIKENNVVNDEVLFKGLGRIRDVAVDSDGNIFVSLNSGSPRVGEIFKLIPAK